MSGKQTPEYLIDQIRELRRLYPAARVVRIMADRGLPRRTCYRLLAQLKKEDKLSGREFAEQTRLALQREEAERIRRAKLMGANKFRRVDQCQLVRGRGRCEVRLSCYSR